jgi:hypothetical protein
MQYFIKVKGAKLDYTTDTYLVGEQSFSNFWPGPAFNKLNNLLANSELMKITSILCDNGNELSVEQFVSQIERLNIVHNAK